MLDKSPKKWAETILKASQFCTELTQKFEQKGYQVQSIRMVTNAFGEYLEKHRLEPCGLYSEVCGIGLDTVPILGDRPTHKINDLMRDTSMLAFRLNKPLTVCLFPTPNLRAGDMTAFESDELSNCAVLAVP